jgi:hypothetical protein
MDEQGQDNVFINSSKGNDTYSLSLYNGAEKYSRPVTAPTHNWLSGFDKLHPVPEEDAVPDTRLPDFKVPPGLHLLNRGANDGYRLEQ